MPARNPHAAVGILGDDLILVIDEDGTRPIPGRLGPMILPLVDGRRSVLDIAAALEGQATIADVAVGVMELVEDNVLVDANTAAASALAPPVAARHRRTTLLHSALSVLAIGAVSDEAVETFTAALKQTIESAIASRLFQSRSVPTATLVVLVDDYLSNQLDPINRECLNARTPWLLVNAFGSVPWIGPMFDPAAGGPCWQCMATRLKEAFPVEAYLRRHYPAVRAPRYARRAVSAAIRQAAAAAAESWLRPPGGQSNCIQTIDTRTDSIRFHPVTPRPGCPACHATDRRLSFGGFRPAAGPVDELPARLAHHVSPITGIVAQVACSSYGPAHIAIADHIFSPEIELPDSLWRACRRRTAGSGTAAVDARTSAVAEALERYSGVYRDSDHGRRSTYRALGTEAIHPNAVMGFSSAQYACRETWNRHHPAKPTRIADLFDENEPRSWTPVVRLGSDEIRWLPTALCYFGAPEPERLGCFADSNGCAAGETFDAALVRGFLELVERDAVGLWWYNRLERHGVDLLTVPDPFVQSLVAYHRAVGRSLAVLDITTDLDVPAFAALAAEPFGDRLTIGFGADFSAFRALRHALLELSLFLPELAAGRRRELFSGPAPNGAYLQPVHVHAWSAWAKADDGPASECGVACVRAVADTNRLDVFVLDQTRADVGVPVVRVIAPGLCHFWPRFGARRLFSVPVRMGWRDRPVREADLNPSYILV